MLQVLSLRRIAPLLMGVLCAAAFLVGSVSAQTTSSSTQDPQAACTSQGYKWCLPQSSGGGSGWCTYSTTMKCPAYTQADCTAQGSVWCKNSDGATGWCSTDSTYKCPAYTEADCKAQGQTWCVSPSGGSPWCTSSCPYSTTTTTQSEQEKCTSGGNKWCKNSDGATGWCSYGSTATCPAYTEADCTAQSGKWCKYAPSTSVGSYTQSTVTGWCQADKTYVCPANTAEECKAQNKIWCTSPYGGSPWCTDTCPYTTTTTTTTPQSEELKCTTGGGKWCKSTTGSPWCSYGTSPCPAQSDTECKAQGGEWCFYSTYTPTASGSTMGSGWCSATIGTCPINDKATCTAKGRTWCDSSYSGTTAGAGSTGWCATTASSCPTKDVTPISSGSWPNTKLICEEMYGRWCENSTSGTSSMYASSGWCQMATRKCPAPYKPGYMTCWDGTEVASTASCPSTPSNESDCTKAGKSWCKSYSGTGGWCSSEQCDAYPPSGQMTCPDGKTFVATYDKCPRRAGVTKPIEVINEYKTCSGGKVVKVSENCPPIENYVMCANGTQAPTLTACPPVEVKKDEISNCLNNNGNWCADNSGKGTGYCQPKGVACGTSVVYPPGPNQPPIEIQNRELSARELKDIERMRKQYVRELNELERVAKRDKNTELVKKIGDLRKELTGMKLTDSSAWDKLRDFQDTMQDLRDALQDSFGSPGEMDEKMQRRALQQMKSGAKQFLRSLEAKKKQVDKLTKQGVNVDTEIVDLLRQAIEMAKLVDKATTYEEVRDIMEQIPDMAEKMNDVFPKLEMLSRLPKAIAVVNKQLSITDKMVKGSLLQAKKRGIHETEQVQRMVQRVADARAALAQVKSGSVSADDIFDFIDASILEPLEEAREIANGVASIANARAAVGKLQASVKQYTARIKKLKAADEDVSQAEEVLAQLNEEIAALRAATTGKITQDVAEEILGSLDSIGDLIQEIESALGLVKPDAILQQIRNSLEKGGEEFDEIRVDDLEKLIVRSFRTALFANSLVGRNVALY